MAPNRFSSTSVRPEPSSPAMPSTSPLRSWKLASFRRVYLPARCSTSRITSPGLLSLGGKRLVSSRPKMCIRDRFGVEDANAVLTAAGKPELAYYNASATDKYLVDQGGKWSAQAANDYMATILPEYSEANGNMVELIICNNDGMAEGAVSALQGAGYNTGDGKTIPVFGVDATDSAKQLINEGKMTGTCLLYTSGMCRRARKQKWKNA